MGIELVSKGSNWGKVTGSVSDNVKKKVDSLAINVIRTKKTIQDFTSRLHIDIHHQGGGDRRIEVQYKGAKALKSSKLSKEAKKTIGVVILRANATNDIHFRNAIYLAVLLQNVLEVNNNNNLIGEKLRKAYPEMF